MPGILLSDVAQGAQAFQDIISAPQRMQQQLAGGAIDVQSKALDLQEKQRKLDLLKSWPGETPIGGNQPTDIKESLQTNINYQQKLASFYDKVDPIVASKLREGVIRDQEKLVQIQDKEQEQQTKNLDTTLGLLELATTPEGLAQAKQALLSIPNIPPQMVDAITKIDSPQAAQEVRKTLMKQKDRMALENRAKELELERQRELRREQEDRRREARAERREIKADKREQSRYFSQLRGYVSSAESNLKDISKEISDINMGITDLKGEEKKAELSRLKAERSQVEDEIKSYREELAGAIERPKGKEAPTKKEEPVQSRFSSDPKMKGYKLGEKTEKGYEVRDKDGKLLGYYK